MTWCPFRDAIAYNKEVAPLVNRAVEVITPLKTLELFSNIRPDEVRPWKYGGEKSPSILAQPQHMF